MSITGLLFRFGLIYFALLVAAGVVLHVLGVQSNSGVNTAALLAAVMWACLLFAKKNQRYFTDGEKRVAALGMLAVDVVLQLLFVFGATSQGSRLGVGPIVFATAFVGAIDAAVIWYFVGAAGKQYAKRVAKGG